MFAYSNFVSCIFPQSFVKCYCIYVHRSATVYHKCGSAFGWQLKTNTPNKPHSSFRRFPGCSCSPTTKFPDGWNGIDRAGVGGATVGVHEDRCQAGGEVLLHRGLKVRQIHTKRGLIVRAALRSTGDQPHVRQTPGSLGCFLNGRVRLASVAAVNIRGGGG